MPTKEQLAREEERAVMAVSIAMMLFIMLCGIESRSAGSDIILGMLMALSAMPAAMVALWK